MSSNKITYTACSNDMVWTPGMFEWAMHCDHNTWNAEASDTAAKMYILAELLPEIPSRVLKLVALGSPKVQVDVDEEQGKVRFTFEGVSYGQ